MPFARLASTVRLAAAASLFATLTLASWAQDAPAAPTPQNTTEPQPLAPAPKNAPAGQPLPVLNYAQPVSHFPNPIGPYTSRRLAPPNLANTARIDSPMRDFSYAAMADIRVDSDVASALWVCRTRVVV
ncbi:MAG: hypothetical protein ACLPWG_03600, partial [Steroidobacteraceae bacterium]